jgi:branched-chain amino acid transport system permease protein
VRIAGVFALIVAAPFLIKIVELETNFALLSQVNRALLFVVLALGLNIVVGFAGLLDLGYAAFFAIGAYTFGVLTWPNMGIEISFFLAIWVCAVVAAIFGILVGAPTLRLRGDYLAIVTLAFGEIIPIMVRNLDEITISIFGLDIITDFNLTNGPQGMNPLGRPQFSLVERILNLEDGTLAIGFSQRFWYYAIIVLAVLVLFSAHRLEHSRLGRAWKAIREDETAADFMGVDPIRTKLLAFALGASFSGLAGVIFASMLGAIFPELFRFQVSIFLLIIVILSGQGSVYGVLLGGLIISTFDGVLLAQVLPEYLPENVDIQSWRWVFFGAGLVIIMIFRPQGLFPPRVPKEVLRATQSVEIPAEALE